MAHCTSCGSPLSPDSVFCGNCGQKAPQPVQPVQPQPAQPAYVQPQPAQPAYVQPQPAQPAYVQPQPQPQPAHPAYVQPQPAQPAYAQPQPQPQPAHPAYAQPQPAQPAYAQPPVQPAYAQPVQPAAQPAPQSADTLASSGQPGCAGQPATAPTGPATSGSVALEPTSETVPRRSPNGRFLELARRLVTLVLLIIGGTAVVFQPEDLFVVEVVDWSAEYAAEDHTKEPITQFIDRTLNGGYRAVSDPAWKAIHEEVSKESASSGKHPRKIFAHNHPLFLEHKGIVVLQQGPERLYLRVGTQSLRYPPSWFSPPFLLVHPYLPYGVPFVFLAILAYALLRWKRTATPVYYKPWGPALLDATSLIFIVPGVFVVARGVQMSWGDAAMAAVILTLIGLSVMLPAAYFASKRALVLQDRVRVLTLFGQTDFPFAKTPTSYIMREAQAPALGIVLIVLGITNLVSAIIGVVLLVRKDDRFTLKRDDGKEFKMWVRSTVGLGHLTRALAANGVANESIG